MDYSVVTTSEGVLVAALIKVKTTKRSKKKFDKNLGEFKLQAMYMFSKVY